MEDVSRERYDWSFSKGKQCEDIFRDRVIALGHRFKYSSKRDNIERHIDCYVDGHGVDVKGNRSFDSIWLETVNVRGNDGWLKGDATYIAFHINESDEFHLFYREELLQFVKENVREETTSTKDYMKFYSRCKWGKKDVIVRVRYDHIKHLNVKII